MCSVNTWTAGLLVVLLLSTAATTACAQAVVLLPPVATNSTELPAPTKEVGGGRGGPPIAITLLDYTIPPGLSGQTPFGYSAIWTPTQRVTDQPANFASLRQDASVGFPLWIAGPDVLIGSVDLRNTQFRTDAVLASSKRPFPEQLWDVQAGVTYIRDLGAGWTMGGGLSIGSPSDKPFHSVREIFPAVNGFLRVPTQGNDAWQYSLTYVPVSLIRFPIPGVAYEWNPSEQLQIAIGVPFSIVWRPTETVRFDFGYLPPQSVRSQLTWQVCRHVSVFGGFEWVNDSYLLADRPDRNDIFYSYEMRLPVGVRFALGKKCTLDLGGGYVFDRLYFSARNFTEQNRDRVHVQPGAFGLLRFAVQF